MAVVLALRMCVCADRGGLESEGACMDARNRPRQMSAGGGTAVGASPAGTGSATRIFETFQSNTRKLRCHEASKNAYLDRRAGFGGVYGFAVFRAGICEHVDSVPWRVDDGLLSRQRQALCLSEPRRSQLTSSATPNPGRAPSSAADFFCPAFPWRPACSGDNRVRGSVERHLIINKFTSPAEMSAARNTMHSFRPRLAPACCQMGHRGSPFRRFTALK